MREEEIKPIIQRLGNGQRITIMDAKHISAYIQFLQDTLVSFNKIIDSCYDIMTDEQIERLGISMKRHMIELEEYERDYILEALEFYDESFNVDEDYDAELIEKLKGENYDD